MGMRVGPVDMTHGAWGTVWDMRCMGEHTYSGKPRRVVTVRARGWMCSRAVVRLMWVVAERIRVARYGYTV